MTIKEIEVLEGVGNQTLWDKLEVLRLKINELVHVVNLMIKEDKNTMAYQEVEPRIWKPEKDGDFVEGVLVTRQEKVGENESMLYGIETPEGVKNVWGSAILDERMAFVKQGDKVKITFKGLAKEAKKGRNPAKIFKVEVDKE